MLFSFSVLVSKVLSFFMLPLYTNRLTTQEYGTIDLVVTTASLLIPVLTLSITDAVLRFSLDKDSDPMMIFSIGLKFLAFGVVLAIVISLIAMICGFDIKLCMVFDLIFITNSIYTLLSQFVRGIGRVKVFALNGIISTSVTIGFNILFLVVFKAGIYGYLSSIIISEFICIIYMSCTINIKQYISFEKRDKEKQREMLKYATPLIPNSISWWVNSLSDRYIIVALCGVGINGIYSAACRLPTLVSTAGDIFMRAWQLSAISELNSKNRNEFYNLIYKYYNLVLVFCCSIGIMATPLLAKILFDVKFQSAWKSAIFLLIGAVFSALNGFIGSLFTATKNSRSLFISTLIGASTNILLNFMLIPILNECGAAIATMTSFFIILIVRGKLLKSEFPEFKVFRIKFILGYILLIVQASVMLCTINNIFVLNVIISLLIIFLFSKDIFLLLEKALFKSRLRLNK